MVENHKALDTNGVPAVANFGEPLQKWSNLTVFVIPTSQFLSVCRLRARGESWATMANVSLLEGT